MSLHIEIENTRPDRDDIAFFGAANIPSGAEWPRDAQGKAMLLLMSIPLFQFPKFSSSAPELICSIFMSYDPLNSDHIYSEILSVNPGGCKFIISQKHNSKPQKRRVIEPSKKASLHHDGKPSNAYWLQDEVKIPNMDYQFQISGASIAQAFPQLNSVFGDEEYYIFVGDILENCLDGRVLVQVT